MPDPSGVIRQRTNLASVAFSTDPTAADVVVVPGGEAIAVTAMYVAYNGPGTFNFTNAAGTVTFFSIGLPAAGQVSIVLPHPFYVSPGDGGFRIDVPGVAAQVTVWYSKE